MGFRAQSGNARDAVSLAVAVPQIDAFGTRELAAVQRLVFNTQGPAEVCRQLISPFQFAGGLLQRIGAVGKPVRPLYVVEGQR